MDIYFSYEYAVLSALIDGGAAESFLFDSEYGSVVYRFIKREIPKKIDGTQYYDIVTPYGYGGPVLISDSTENRAQLVQGFCEAFDKYCIENNVVSEFVRFHPIYKNADDFKEVYNVRAIRKTVCTDLLCSDDPIRSEFSKSCRKNIKKSLKLGVTYRVTRAPESIDVFIDIYYSTMNRDNAAEYYYFDKKYFDSLLELFKKDLIFVEAVYENKIIAASLCFVSDDKIYIHLSGTLSEYLHLSPAYILRYAVVKWGKENGVRLIHHGGGISNSSDDKLYRFKKQFGLSDFDFCVGKMIRNREIYSKLCEAVGNSPDDDFFPAYRKR